MGDECSEEAAVVPPEELAGLIAKHPCYSPEAYHRYARMHLPVAPVCNISCNYCNRRFDCVNESRPGVTSELLTPEQCLAKFIRVRAELPQLSVIGIAGPGDALANWPAVRRTIRLIQAQAPETIFCLSTNGLLLPHCGPELIDLGIKHVTVTVNCLDPAIGARLYHHVNYDGYYFTGERAAAILAANQMAGIQYLAERGVLVKVNMVLIDEINAGHLAEVARKVKRAGAFIANIMPLLPAPGSAFENRPQTSMRDLQAVREICQPEIRQMRHCRQCRADAVGLLGEDLSAQYRNVETVAPPRRIPAPRPYQVAVTAQYRRMVDLHYGHAEEFHIYEIDGTRITFRETREAAKYCAGADCNRNEADRDRTLRAIRDCDAVLTMRIGHEPQRRLQANGIAFLESCDSIEAGLCALSAKLTLEGNPGVPGDRMERG